MNRTRRKAMKMFRRKYGSQVDPIWCEPSRMYVVNWKTIPQTIEIDL